jgi:hypothetical protein
LLMKRHWRQGTHPLQNPCSNPTVSVLYLVATANQHYLLLVWRRGWAFEVAFATTLLQRGPAPS